MGLSTRIWFLRIQFSRLSFLTSLPFEGVPASLGLGLRTASEANGDTVECFHREPNDCCFQVLRPGRAHGRTRGARPGANWTKQSRSPSSERSITMGYARQSFPFVARRTRAGQFVPRARTAREGAGEFTEMVSLWYHFAPCKNSLLQECKCKSLLPLR